MYSKQKEGTGEQQMSGDEQKITVLVVEPCKKTYTKEVGSLEEMQALVGGHIETVPLSEKEPVVAVVNEDGKGLGLPYNRPLNDDNGIVYDILCGTFFVAGAGEEDFVSLTDDQIRRYKEKYDNEMILTVPVSEKTNHHKKEKKHHER